MKAAIVLSIAVVLGACSSGLQMATQEEMRHEHIAELPGAKKDVVFERIQRWIAQNFVSGSEVMDVADKNAGTIVAKGIIPVHQFSIGSAMSFGGRRTIQKIKITLTIDIKDEKVRFRYAPVVGLWAGNDGELGPQWSETAEFHRNVKDELVAFTEVLKTAAQQDDKDF